MIKAEPYRILFSLGLLAALVGLSLWPLFQAGQLAYYPREPHAQLMIFGFLLAFASGFLMTAAPRMSGALPSKPWETVLASALVLAQIFTQINFPGEKMTYGLALLQFAFLFRFLLSRRPRSAGGRTPPPYFLFLPLGLLLGSAGCVLRLLDVPLEELSRILLYKGFLMCLILGVGIRLLPVFLAGAATPMEAATPEYDASSKEARIVAVAYILALFTEASLPWLGSLLQLCLLAGLLQFRLKISQPPLGRGVQPWGVWVSLWCLLAGQVWVVVWPQMALHGMHLIYIGGWGLMAFMVATRVVLSHGGFSLAWERNSKILAAAVLFWIFSALTRASMAILPMEIFWSHATYSALCWAIGAALWVIGVGWKITQIDREVHDEECKEP